MKVLIAPFLLFAGGLTIMFALFACGKNPQEVLRAKGRPEPVECVYSRGATICTDGAGVVWACEGMGVARDDKCIMTGTLPAEISR